jgi:hypothetical protein
MHVQMCISPGLFDGQCFLGILSGLVLGLALVLGPVSDKPAGGGDPTACLSTCEPEGVSNGTALSDGVAISDLHEVSAAACFTGVMVPQNMKRLSTQPFEPSGPSCQPDFVDDEGMRYD